MSDWDKHVFRLPEDHGWTAKPGNVVFIADRGALRFEIPQDWLVKPSKKSVKFLDGEPPDDNIVMEVSISYLAAAYGKNVDWSGLPLSKMVKDVASAEDPAGGKGGRRIKKTKIGTPLAMNLGSMRMAWVETEFMEPVEKRPAHSRIGIALDTEAGIHAVLTMSFWPEDGEVARRVWNDAFGTIKMGEHYEHPFFGPGRLS